jgi:hypothetical protein
MNTIYLLLACAAVVAIAAVVCWIGARRDEERAKWETLKGPLRVPETVQHNGESFDAELKRLDDEIKLSLR